MFHRPFQFLQDLHMFFTTVLSDDKNGDIIQSLKMSGGYGVD